MLTSKTIANGILRAIGVLAIIVLSLYFIYKLESVIIYIIVSIIFSLIANTVVEFLRKKLKFSNTIAVVTTLMFFFLLIVGIILLFVPLIVTQSNNLSLLDTNSIQKKTIELFNQLNLYLSKNNINTSKILSESNITSKLNFSFLTDFFNSIISGISSFGITIATMFFITFFFLKDKVKFIIGFKQILPDKNEDKILNSLDKIRELLSRYFIGLLLQLSIIGIMYFIVLLIFGVENALIIAFLCALLNVIPYLGALISAILAAVLTMLGNINADFQTVTLPTTIYVIICFTLVQVIDNNVSQPIIFSKSVNSHPLEIFLVILISGVLFGITGMIIAVPSYTILKVICKEFFPNNKVIQLLTKNI